MFPRLTKIPARPAVGCSRRNYATRRVINDPPVTPPSTRTFKSMGQLQGQPALGETASLGGGFESGIFENNIPISQVPIRQPVQTPGFRFPEPQVPLRSSLGISTKKAAEIDLNTPSVPLYYHGNKFERVPYWQKIPRWKNVSEKDFLTYSWQASILSFAQAISRNEISRNQLANINLD